MSTNISLYTVPAAWLLCLVPHIYATSVYERASSKKFDNRQPRLLITMVAENPSIDSVTKGRIIRAEFAQQNGFENIGFFAAAVVAANMAGVGSSWLNGLTAGYLVSRVLYTVIYVTNTTAALATLRTGVFISSSATIWTLFILAGNKLANVA